MAKTKYQDDFPKRVYEFAREGLTDEQIAIQLRISPSSFYDYRLKYPDFDAALVDGRNAVDIKVENTLLALALGRCSVTTTVTDSEGRTRTSVRDLPPNVKALIYLIEKRSGSRSKIPAEIRRQQENHAVRNELAAWIKFLRQGVGDAPELEVAIEETPDPAFNESPSSSAYLHDDTATPLEAYPESPKSSAAPEAEPNDPALAPVPVAPDNASTSAESPVAGQEDNEPAQAREAVDGQRPANRIVTFEPPPQSPQSPPSVPSVTHSGPSDGQMRTSRRITRMTFTGNLPDTP